MTEKEYIKKLELVKDLMDAYYIDDDPKVSDEEYDALIRELKRYEIKHGANLSSPTQLIGPKPQSGFKKLAHKDKMWSMEDIFSKEQLLAWIKRSKYEGDFFIEPKFDGASLNLYYENGFLKSAATRGDGKVGEDVSLNARSIKGVLKKIAYKEPIEIRGEVLMLKKDFLSLNEQRASKGLKLFANPRNAASGSLRQLDSSITKERKLIFLPWGLGLNSLEFTKHHEQMDFLKELGFIRDDFVYISKDYEELLRLFKSLEAKRSEKSMMLDGMVIRLDDISSCQNLGFTVKYPRFMVAFKFKALKACTKLLDIAYQIGRSGAITPVAIMQEVELGGVRINRASLHNFDEIKRLDLKINDLVALIRSADVIPKISKVYIEKRQADAKDIIVPKLCPYCKGTLSFSGPLLYCENSLCEGRRIQELIYFVSKKAMNIEGLGKSIIKLLFKKKLLSKPLDIYSLKEEDFKNLEGFKEKKIKNILNSIKKSKNTTLSAFINALGIAHIGEVAAKELANNYQKTWYKKDYEAYLSLAGFGEEMAKSLQEFCLKNIKTIESFYELLSFENFEPKSSILENKSFVITGTLSRPRSFYIDYIQKNSGKITSSLSIKTSFLLCGAKPGQKLEKAQKLGVKILNEDDFLALFKLEN